MAQNSADDFDRLQLVSSFYGPGTTGCWYFTTLSCLLLWTLHPKRKNCDSIDTDFIAVLTYPVVAAGHLVVQLTTYTDLTAEMMTTKDPAPRQAIASIEAALTVNEIYYPICLLLFCLAARSRCTRRMCLLACSGLFCFTAEGYMLTSAPKLRNTHGNPDRFFLADAECLFASVFTLFVSAVLVMSSTIAAYYLARTVQNRTRQPQTGKQAMLFIARETMRETRSMHVVTFVTLVLLPSSLIPGLISVSSDILSLFLQTNVYLFPQTNLSIAELDQAVAMFAGGTVLAFSVFNITHTYHKHWRTPYQSAEPISKLESRRWILEYQENHIKERGWEPQDLSNSVQKAKHIREGDTMAFPHFMRRRAPA
ncbi:hypothetical protein BFJ63_vAg19001 [Fusarium oxysporum f. sp. narcissi]|uniref:Uncharacterized protein n=1 Tax=Fusarium oxysporum f. sp. narcissi TaxID=451672 RepID=A0A4Q2UUY1_FUSOX|nr:hypothetical protein BFJ63_vAg19001 [Fusarium oxysporum f. sp. narcissi]